MYDIVVVGGGIGGIYIIYKLLKEKIGNNKSILLLEKEDRLGGRIKTITRDNLNFESGAGRLGKHHIELNKLITELQLDDKLIPITNLKSNYDLDNIIKYLENVNLKELEKTTIIGYLKKTKQNDLIEKLYQSFPYYSETHVLNGLYGLKALKDDFNNDKKYYVLNGGLEQIIVKMISQIKKMAKKNHIILDIKLNHQVEKINNNNIILSSGKIINVKNKIILNLPSKSLIKLFPSNKYLKSVIGEPLYRIYAKYNPNDIQDIKFLWDDKILLPSPLRFVIPIDVNSGLIMISYTDGLDTNFWIDKLVDKGNDGIIEIINKSLKLNFPKQLKNIPLHKLPKPEWIEHCYYEVGAHYWKPNFNNNSLQKIIKKIINFNQNILIVGEAYSNHQAWIEGSLETANIALDTIKNNSNLEPNNNIQNGGNNQNNQTKNTNRKNTINEKYKLNEVAKHNSRSDAWIIIDNNVYDITNWIDKHPGGNIIMRGVGKNATELFITFGHSEKARQILHQYFIGTLDN